MPLWTWWTVAGTLLAAGGLVAAWGLFGDRSRSRRCLRCGYDMTAVPGLRCPECGREARNEAGLVGTRRRLKAVASGAILLLAGSAIGAHLIISDSYGGWWRFAPSSVLLSVLELPSADSARDALSRRIQSDDPMELMGRQEALSATRWRHLAECCERIITSDEQSDDMKAWAVSTLSGRIPDTAITDPIIERLLRDGNCAARGWIAIGVTTGYYKAFGTMSEAWADDLVSLATDPTCMKHAVGTATLAARLNPLPRDLLRRIAADLRGKHGFGQVWQALTLGLARGQAPEEERLAMLEELAAGGDPAVERFVSDALAEMASYRQGR